VSTSADTPLDLTAQGYKIAPHSSFVWQKVLARNPAANDDMNDTETRCFLNVVEEDWWIEFPHAKQKRFPRYSREVSVQVDREDGSVRMVWWGMRDVAAALPAIEKEALAWWEGQIARTNPVMATE